MKFITFEGIDGSGKSTIMKFVFKKLKNNGYNVISTYEPTNTKIGKYVQRYIEENSDPFLTTLTFIADRMQHNKEIIKWLTNGKIVLCDRYVESTYAYQGAQLEDFIDKPIYWLKDLSSNHIIVPDRTYIFLIDPDKSIKRIKNREKLISFEKASFLDKVQNNYIKISKEKRFLKLDATKSIEELVNICYKDIVNLIS
jgi:dTMP kinase